MFRAIAPIIINAGDAEIYGGELELTALPLPQLRISAGVGYLDAEYTAVDPDADEVAIDNLLPFRRQ